MKTLHKLFSGKERASRVFWLWGGVFLFLLSLMSMGTDIFLPALSGVMLFIYDACCAAWSYCMWRCAFSETHHVWGVFYRFVAVIMLLVVLTDVPEMWQEESVSASDTSLFLNLLSSGRLEEYILTCQEETAQKKRSGQTSIPDSLFLSQCLMRHAKELQSQKE